MNDRVMVTHSGEVTRLCNIGPGTRLLNNKFELEEQLGEGGFGVVFRAVDRDALQVKDPCPRLALKVLNEETQGLRQARVGLQRELSCARRLTHPNIVRVYEFYEDRGICFMTMELLDGTPWDALIRSHPGGMPFKEAVPLIEQLCAALTYAHAQGVVHSDLKPQNLFLTRLQQVKVLDFGIAAQLFRPTVNRNQHRTIYDARQLGAWSERYAPLEVWQQWEADPRDDVYSAACIVYELLSGAHPFAGRSAPQALQYKLAPPPIKSLTGAQNLALHQALQLSREERTLSIEAFATQLLAPQPSSWRRKWPVAPIAALAGVLAAAAILLLVPRKPHPAPPPTPQAGIPSAQKLVRPLNMVNAPVSSGAQHSHADVLAAVASAPRRALLGSSPEQLDAAVALCRKSSQGCDALYSDETFRRPVLAPFRLDPTAVTVAAFRKFIASTHYQTEAERARGAYALSKGALHWNPGGNWTNAAGTGSPSEQSAVVSVSFADAQAFCRWRGARLPTEDEWEYAARGPSGWVFPWGDDPGPARVRPTHRPEADEGPAEGPDGTLHGLAGNVWEWVDTAGRGGKDSKTLKGGSWLEENPANKRAAVRRYELAARADSDSGFRCAQSLALWPDASLVSQK
jgi:serine/threonine protein kinase